MQSNEKDHEDWKEIRARADSLANAVFLIAGSSLTLSVTVLINLHSVNKLPIHIASNASCSWSLLLWGMLIFIFLKGFLMLQSYQRSTNAPEIFNRSLNASNVFAWLVGISGLVLFSLGMLKMVAVAKLIINA